LSKGMTSREVVDLMGDPDVRHTRTRKSPGDERTSVTYMYLIRSRSLPSDYSPNTSDEYFHIEFGFDGKVDDLQAINVPTLATPPITSGD